MHTVYRFLYRNYDYYARSMADEYYEVLLWNFVATVVRACAYYKNDSGVLPLADSM